MEKKNSIKHGGKRAGAGNKKGKRKEEVATTSSINLPPSLWAKLDLLKGSKSRSMYLRSMIEREPL